MRKRIQKKTLIGSFLGLTMLGDLAQAHQFTQTNISHTATTQYKAIMIEASSPLNDGEKDVMYKNGIDSIVYAGNLHYYLYGDLKNIQAVIAKIDKIEKASAITAQAKTSSYLSDNEASISTLSSGAPMRFNILLLKEMTKESLEAYFDELGIEATIYEVTAGLKSAKIRIAAEDYERVKNLPLIHYMDRSHSLGVSNHKMSRNAKSVKLENIPALWSGKYRLNGEGMTVAVVDGGLVRKTHQEFMEAGRSSVVISNNNSSFADHATHVAGTIIADGDDAKAKGVASKATLYSYTFADSSFADSAVRIYQKDSVLFSNHSYGYSEKIKLGEYDSEASKQDRAVSANPYLNIFEAAGNDGENSDYPSFGKIKGPGNSKNILTIGALNTNGSGVARFSSNGPSKDGRIKPELCARGESVYSTAASSDTDYFWMDGTSMATPSATGIGVLVAQAYKQKTGGYDIRHDVLKATLINTAVDKGRAGPDFDAGFGMIDAKAAVDVINTLATDRPLIYADTITHGESRSLEFVMPTSGLFKATLSWVDPEASPSARNALVNDIDMWLENSAGKKFYPYTLDANNPTALAVNTKQNHVDNNEQIEVKNLPAGNYTLVIKGREIVSSAQEFALVSNIAIADASQSQLASVEPSKLRNFAKVIQDAIQ